MGWTSGVSSVSMLDPPGSLIGALVLEPWMTQQTAKLPVLPFPVFQDGIYEAK